MVECHYDRMMRPTSQNAAHQMDSWELLPGSLHGKVTSCQCVYCEGEFTCGAEVNVFGGQFAPLKSS